MVIAPVAIVAGLLAGLLQAWRTALQQRLRAELTVSGAGLVRYAYGAPVALLLASSYLGWHGEHWPAFNLPFLGFAAAGGLAQILGTNALIAAFGHRGFVAGTAFSKTEALQAALFSFVILGERLALLVWLGILAGLAGVVMLAIGGTGKGLRELRAQLAERGATLGLIAGAFFAITGVLVKLATERLPTQDFFAAGLVTLVAVLFLQALMHGLWVLWREPATLRAVVRTWRSSSQVGILAAMGSACWFTGFAVAPVAFVRLVGQVEVLFTLGFSHWFLAEPVRRHEVAGLLLVVLGVALALAGAF